MQRPHPFRALLNRVPAGLPRRWARRVLGVLVVLLLLPLLAYGLFLFPAVQKGAARQAAAWAERRAGTEVRIDRIRLRMVRKLYFGGVHVADFNGDTLLHAGELVVRVDRFQPFRRRLDVRAVRAREAHFTMRRERADSLFSFTEFTRSLAGGPSAEGGGGGKPWKLGLGGIELADSRFRYLDARNRTFLTVDMPYFGVAVRRADPVTRFLHARSIDARDLDVRMVLPDTLKGPRLKPLPEVPTIDPGGWVFRVDELRFRDSRYAQDTRWRAPREGLDFGHLDVRGIELALRDVSYAGDTILARIDRMEGRDHSGAVIRSMEADCRFSTGGLDLTGLRLETPGSVLKDTFRMRYASFRDFADFPRTVRMDARLDGSRLALADLRWFAPGLEALDGGLDLSGDYSGTVADLRGRDVALAFGGVSRLRGRFDVNGLPDLETAFIEFRLEELRTRAADLAGLLPGVDLPPNLPVLGTFSASGEFIGFPRDFVAFGNLETAIGSVRSDINLKIDRAADNVGYSGSMALDAFDLGQWTGNTEWLGPASVSGTVEGSGRAEGFGMGNLSARLKANASRVVLRGYPYRNMDFDGALTEGFIEGSLESRDPNFDQTFEGTIDLRGEAPVFDFRSDLRFTDLQALGFSPSPLRMIAELDLALVGDHIDSLLGQASVRHLFLQDSLRIYTLDSLRLEAAQREGRRSLELNGPGIAAAFEGHFQLTRMPDAIRQLLGTYFPGSGIRAREPVPDQDLTFAISIRNSRGFQRLLNPRLGDLHRVYASGSLRSDRNAFDVRARIPDPKLGRWRMTDWLVDVQTDAASINLFSRFDALSFGDSVLAPVTELRADYGGDSLLFRLLMGGDTDAERLNLAGVVTAADSAFRFRILPSEIALRNQVWTMDPQNRLVLGREKLLAQNFVLRNGEQRIALHSLDKPGYRSWVDLDLEAVRIGELLDALDWNPVRLSGTLGGRVSASDLFQQAGFAGSLRLENMAVDGLPFGSTLVSASLQRPENRLNYTVALTGENRLTARGRVPLADPAAALEADLNIERLDVAPFGRYLAGLFDGIEGQLSGTARLRGSARDPDISGQLRLRDAGLRLVYLNGRYRIPSVDLDWTDGRLAIRPTTVLDPQGNEARLEGALAYGPLDSWRFEDLRLETGNLLFMNTTREQNPTFFGTAYGGGTVRVDGPFSDLTVTVAAASNPGTSFLLPITYGPSVGGSDFIRFLDPGDEEDPALDEDAVRKRLSRVRFDLFLDIDEDAEVGLELLGDRLRGRGRGTLQLNLSTLGDFSMSGIYEVREGDYTFSFQDVITKDFRLSPGSRVVFSGDPYQAQLDVDAFYTVRATEYDLIGDRLTEMSAAEIERAKTPQDVEVWLELTGSLSQPEIGFDIRQRSGGGTSVFERRLFEIKQDENELNKQVFGLLVMNRFIPDESGITPLLSSASSSVSEFLSKQLSVYLTDWLSSFLLEDVNVDISYRNFQTAEDQLTQQELQVALSTQIFNDRISVNLGGNFDLNQNAGVQNVTDPGNGVAGDFEIAYDITPDGRIRLKAFQRSDYDLYLGRNVGETGVGIFYSTEFDNLYDLVADRRRRRALKAAEEAAEDGAPAP